MCAVDKLRNNKMRIIKILFITTFFLSSFLKADYIKNTQTSNVYDTSTSFTWQDNEVKQLSWSEANEYCKNLDITINQEWILPNFNQLFMLASRDKFSPAINIVFINIKSDLYWTSTTDLSNESNAWLINFKDGSISSQDKSQKKYVRCVQK